MTYDTFITLLLAILGVEVGLVIWQFSARFMRSDAGAALYASLGFIGHVATSLAHEMLDPFKDILGRDASTPIRADRSILDEPLWAEKDPVIMVASCARCGSDNLRFLSEQSYSTGETYQVFVCRECNKGKWFMKPSTVGSERPAFV